MQEIRAIGKEPRFFSDDFKHEYKCICGPQPLRLPGERELSIWVEDCQVHGRAAKPYNWR